MPLGIGKATILFYGLWQILVMGRRSRWVIWG